SRGNRRLLMGKFSTARCVCAPHSASAGTCISPSESFSILNFVSLMVPRCIRHGYPELTLTAARCHSASEWCSVRRADCLRAWSHFGPGGRLCRVPVRWGHDELPALTTAATATCAAQEIT